MTIMSKTPRKGIKIKTPFAEGWYEETIEGIKEDVKKGGKRGLFHRSKIELDVGRRFRDFLSIAEKDMEMYLWFAKSFAVRNDLGKEIDSEIDNWFGRTIGIFNTLLQRFDANTL